MRRRVEICRLRSPEQRGRKHFTTRIQDLASRWWSYNGMWRFGAAQRDRVQSTTDLLHNGHRPVGLLVYRRRDH